jgi:dolichol-phosphate mannosyltransferase
MGFAGIGASGLVINGAVFTALTVAGVRYFWSALVAMELSAAWNFFLYDRYFFSASRKGRPLMARAGSFLVTANATFAIGSPLLIVFRHVVGLPPMLANFLSIASTMVIRFLLADKLIWSGKKSSSDIDLAIAGTDQTTRAAITNWSEQELAGIAASV